MEELAQSKPGVIEKVLHNVKAKIEEIKEGNESDKDSDFFVMEGFANDSSGNSKEFLMFCFSGKNCY